MSVFINIFWLVVGVLSVIALWRLLFEIPGAVGSILQVFRTLYRGRVRKRPRRDPVKIHQYRRMDGDFFAPLLCQHCGHRPNNWRHKPSRVSVDELEIWHHEWRMQYDPEYAEVFGDREEREPRGVERWDGTEKSYLISPLRSCITHGGPKCICGIGAVETQTCVDLGCDCIGDPMFHPERFEACRASCRCQGCRTKHYNVTRKIGS
jgi:hypothetical protein